MSKLCLLAVLFFPFLIPGTVHAQQFDVAFGVGTLTAPSASSASGNHNPVSLTGGAYPVFSADLLLKKQFGVSGELAWRSSRNLYAGFQPYRPLFYDFNGIYAPKLGNHAAAEVMAGIGWESLRFYTGPSIAAQLVVPISSAATTSWATSAVASATTFTAISLCARKLTST